MVRQISKKPLSSPLSSLPPNISGFTPRKPNISNLTYVITMPIFSLFKKDTWTQHGLRVILFTACVATGIYFIKKHLKRSSAEGTSKPGDQLTKVTINSDEKSGLARTGSSSGGASSRFSLRRVDSMGRQVPHIGPSSPNKHTLRRTKTRDEDDQHLRERTDSEGSTDDLESSRLSNADERAAILLEKLREQKQAAADKRAEREAELSAQARTTREKALESAMVGERLGNRGDMGCGTKGCCTIM